jgi:hypothetical protein
MARWERPASALIGVLFVAQLGVGARLPLYQLSTLDYLASEPLTSAAVFPAQYPAAEVPGGAPAVAWVRGTGAKTFRIALTNPTEHAHSATLVFSDTKFLSPSGTVPLTFEPASVQLDFPAFGESNVVEVQVFGLPDHVSLGPLTFDLSCQSPHAVLYGDEVGHMLYLLDGTPRGQGEGDQVPVWKEVLDDACWWARGVAEHGPVRDAVTVGLFGCGYANYNGGNLPEYFVTAGPQSPATFDLTAWSIDKLFHFVTPDCSDTACYLQIACAALGVPMQMATHKPLGVGGGFRTNLICPIGDDPYGSYIRANWGFHRTGYVAGVVWDACAAQFFDPAGGLWRQPAYSWLLVPYWQNWITPTIACGLAKGYWGIPDGAWWPVGRRSTLFDFQDVL